MNPSTDSDPAARLRAVIGKLSGRLRLTEAGTGLTPSQTSVLFTIVRLGPLGLTEISEIERINPTMLSRITAQLCQLGADQPRARPRGQARGARAGNAGGAAPAQAHPPRAHRGAAAAHGKLTDEQRELLWSALPVLEALAEQIPGGRPMTRLLGAGRTTFKAFEVPNYRRYFAGQAISLSGTWMQMAAQSWLVLTLTGSATTLGLIVALQTLPILLLGPYGGVIADRVDKRRTDDLPAER